MLVILRFNNVHDLGHGISFSLKQKAYVIGSNLRANFASSGEPFFGRAKERSVIFVALLRLKS